MSVTKYTSTSIWSVCEHRDVHVITVKFLGIKMQRLFCMRCRGVYTFKEMRKIWDFQKRLKNKAIKS